MAQVIDTTIKRRCLGSVMEVAVSVVIRVFRNAVVIASKDAEDYQAQSYSPTNVVVVVQVPKVMRICNFFFFLNVHTLYRFDD